ncbi:HPP family protein [Leucobacter triazinivorans]|uniref:HPP family protein n=1 Tax=Leucobacter triazinivorans TaxID=1784719 RepID=A0A4P6KHP1_9MICO|nr:HPP family protein [Leucobacter triazinivorans]QBE49508.1 HPP family protein [Leucobacter triazinivorans]
MSKGSDRDRGRAPEPPSPQARRKQIIVGIVMGAIVGVVLGALTQFWLWLPAGLALGLATGAIMKPPAE